MGEPKYDVAMLLVLLSSHLVKAEISGCFESLLLPLPLWFTVVKAGGCMDLIQLGMYRFRKPK